MSPVQWQRIGPRALMFTFADRADINALELCRACVAEMERDWPPGATDIIPAITSLLIEWPSDLVHFERTGNELATRLEAVQPGVLPEANLRRIPVRYQGEDLEWLARECGLGKEEVVAIHAGTEYRVMMMGFAPGFAYLGPLDPRLHVPRRAKPRTRIEPGSVAIGGEHTGIYSVATPGGWHLIGRTSVSLFDSSSDLPFLLKQGDRVRFIPEEP